MLTTGIDIGDRYCEVCILDERAEVLERSRVRTSQEAIGNYFKGREPMHVAMEVGTHSPWIARLVEEAGHSPIVANARRVRLIYADTNKDDGLDAEKLARLARFDSKLLMPIVHRGKHTQAARSLLNARDVMVRARTMLINSARGSVKAFGSRLRKCSAGSFHKLSADVPEILSGVLEPIFEQVQELTLRIRAYERQIEELCEQDYPETMVLREVPGVGAMTALAFVTTLEEPDRFENARAVGAFLGLTPRRFQSSASNPQLRITKAGDEYLRRLLVGSANYILGPFGPDTDLRRWGMRLAERGGKNARQRAKVAVARKLAVLLFRLWVTGEVYEPLRQANQVARSHQSDAAGKQTFAEAEAAG